MHSVNKDFQQLRDAPWIRIVPLRTPTLPPATHTNVYLFGEDELIAVDPASPWQDEQAALDRTLESLSQEGRRLTAIFLTHHHVDHVSGAAHLRARTGAPILAHPITAEKLDGQLAIDRTIDEGERLPYGPAGLEAIFTPGHAPGHLCLADAASGALVAGDMVASVGTIIIEPADGGDMRAYLDSLARLRARDARCLLPAHGPPIDDPAAKLDFYRRHRLEREARVLAALGRDPRPLLALVPPAYPDVPPAIYGLAARSLLAHLLKLEAEGRARRSGDDWALA
jgi:glyoxylase-like metal-dependent hydrolase (beta-lactamase superfamily II)